MATAKLPRPCKVKMLSLDDLYVDEGVQRGKIKKHVNTILEKFDPEAIKIFRVSKRDNGQYSILDGQQECWVLRQLGYTHWMCDISENFTPQRECLLFNKLQSQKCVSLLIQFRNAVRGGDEQSTAIYRIVKSNGFEMGADKNGRPHKGVNVLRCIAQLQKIYRMEKGAKLLDESLGLIQSVFTLHSGSVDAIAKKDFFIRGVAEYLAKGEMNVEKVVEVLQDGNVQAKDIWTPAVNQHGDDRKGVEEWVSRQISCILSDLLSTRRRRKAA
jgi:hypothetical protein